MVLRMEAEPHKYQACTQPIELSHWLQTTFTENCRMRDLANVNAGICVGLGSVRKISKPSSCFQSFQMGGPSQPLRILVS